MKIMVAQGVQVVHQGEVYADGASADVPDDVGAQWVSEGWVTEVKAKGTHR
jgi:hypothetical protein